MVLPPPRIPSWVRTLLIVPLLVFGLAGVVAPPAIAFGLIRRGVIDSRHGSTILGAIVGLGWILLFAMGLRKLLRSGTRNS